MTHDTTTLQVHIMSCFGRHEAHCGDSTGYSHVSRTDALQNLLSRQTWDGPDYCQDSRAQHPHDWPERGTPLHAAMALLRGVL